MLITHTNSLYSENIHLIDWVNYPQYVHMVSDGGMSVSRGLKIMASELINLTLNGYATASSDTPAFIKSINNSEYSKVGLILAAGGTIWTGYDHNIKKSIKYPIYKIPILGMTNIHLGHIASKLGTFDYLATDSTSCISGHSAWFNARNMLTLGLLDAVVVISADNGISEEYLDIFGSQNLAKLATEENSAIEKFRLGQGCNISVFESEKFNEVTGNTPVARITDMCIASEVHGNPVGISPTGQGYDKVISRVDTTGINFIKTHSTFSEDNKIEEELIRNKFVDIRLVNYKLRIGHTMGTSTALETALAIQEESGKFLSLGAGMGNVFSSAVVDIL